MTQQSFEYEQVTLTHEEEKDIADEDLQQIRSSSSQDWITVDEAIERLSMGPFQRTMTVTLGLFFAADAMQVMLLSLLTIVLQKDWDISPDTSAVIATAFFAGSLVGNLILGPLADSMGRRPVFLLASLEVAVMGLAVAVAPTFPVLVLLVFFVGAGVGGLTIPFDILAEFVPSDGRGTNLLFINYFWTLGSLFVVVVAYLTLHGSHDNWRLFVALCPFPCAISLVMGYLYIPESARWLVTKGRNQEAMDILRMAAQKNGLEVDLVFPPHVALAPEPQHEEATIGDLFQPKWAKIILFLWGTWGLSAFGYYGTILAITNVFSDEDTSNNDNSDSDSNNGEYHFDFGAILVSSAAELLGTTVAIAAVDRMGRISAQVISYALAGLSVGLMCLLSSAAPYFLLVALGFSARIFEMSATCLTWVTTAEVLTTEIRGAGHSTANAVGRIGAMCAPYMVVGSTPPQVLGIVMLFTHTCTVWCISHVPETQGRDMGSPTDDGYPPDEQLTHSDSSDDSDADVALHDHTN